MPFTTPTQWDVKRFFTISHYKPVKYIGIRHADTSEGASGVFGLLPSGVCEYQEQAKSNSNSGYCYVNFIYYTND